jgi:hypothetical protein
MLDSKTAQARDTRRTELVAEIPRWYRPDVHLAATTLIGACFSALAVFQIHHLRPVDLWTVPAIWLLSNASEWRLHRDLLHKLKPWARVAFVRHTLQHHQLYFTDDMEIRSGRELRLVLLPPFAIAGVFLGTLPVTAALWLAFGRNVAALFVITTQGYVVSYEWLHMFYHLPRKSFIGRRWLIRKLGRHHAVHHAPERMNVWNMNVNFPLWDWVRGTIYRGEIQAADSVSSAENATTAS